MEDPDIHMTIKDGAPGLASLRSRISRNQVLAGLLLFLLGNVALLAFKPLSRVDPESLPAAHTWVWWATSEFLSLKRAPQVVLLGSSLVMHPVSRCDADYLGRDLDYVKHHRSLYMEDSLSKRLASVDPVCYNFALPGGMMSDDYLVSRALFQGARKPGVIILGLSIRDFIDNGVHCAGATPAFRYLKRYCDTDDLIELAMPEIWQRFDYTAGKLVYLWGKKLDIQVILAERLKLALAAPFQSMFAPSKLDQANPARNMPSNLRSEVEEGMFIVKARQPFSWEDNSGEYHKRYRSANEKTFVIQVAFLDKLMQLARQRGMSVVLVNMPLTPANHALMPQGAYQRYLSMLTETGERYGCTFVNLDVGGKFLRENFYDTSHMNGSGGKKLIDSLVSVLCADVRLAEALGAPASPRSLSTRQVAGKGQSLQ